MNTPNRTTHIRLTSHPEPGTAAARFPISWAAASAQDHAGRHRATARDLIVPLLTRYGMRHL